MSYKEKPQIKLYKYENSAFVLQAIIDDFAECSFENNRYSAGQFSITINYNIPNALKFQRGLWVQFGNDHYAFGEIQNVTDSIGEDGKGSQIRIITGYDARYIFKRRIIKNLNNVENWQMTAKGEICMRNLIKDQCGSGAELKRQLPITNVIPEPADAIGKSYSVAESFTNLYEVLVTIATQTEIGWRINFNGSLSLEFYEGTDRHLTVRFDTDYESLSNGEFKDSAEAFANSVYVGGKGTGSDRDIYEGESAIEGESPSGLERFEAWDNQSSMNTESEYEAEALSILNQYGQTLQVSGQGLAKCPYEYGKEYNVGDIITIAFSGKSAVVQILSVTEHWAWGSYDLEFSFGKPQPDLNKQLQLILKQIQKASNKNSTTDSVRWYTIPTDTAMPSGDVVYTTIGFVGTCAENGSTFQLYLDDEKTGAKTYHVYFKQLGGGNLTLTTGKTGVNNLVMPSGTYVAIIYVDELGNVTMAGATATSTIEAGNNLPATSEGVYQAIRASGGIDFNTVYPIGCTYTQYPMQKSPMQLWGTISTWEVINYGGAFFRAEGGNAMTFDANIKAITAVSGSTITIADHGASVGTVILDYAEDSAGHIIRNESRVVTAVSGNVLTLNSQFTSTNLRNVLIGQFAQNYSHTHERGTMNIKGTVSNGSDRVFFPTGSSGALYTSNARANYIGSFWEGGKSSQTLNFDASRNWTGATSENGGVDARPTNFTYKIWVRTA